MKNKDRVIHSVLPRPPHHTDVIASILVLCALFPIDVEAIVPPPSLSSVDALTSKLEVPEAIYHLHDDLLELAPLSVSDPEFWVELVYTGLDYSPWTPEPEVFTERVVEHVASAMGLFSTSRRYRISSRFGPRYHPILKRHRQHNGLDLAAPRGTPIRAAQDGTITYAKRRGASGKLVSIDHADSWVTEYAHMSQISVLSGAEVKQGDIIGKVGTTGRSTGPHLHFVVKEDGVPVDPLGVQGFSYMSPIVPLSYNLVMLKREQANAMATK